MRARSLPPPTKRANSPGSAEPTDVDCQAGQGLSGRASLQRSGDRHEAAFTAADGLHEAWGACAKKNRGKPLPTCSRKQQKALARDKSTDLAPPCYVRAAPLSASPKSAMRGAGPAASATTSCTNRLARTVQAVTAACNLCYTRSAETKSGFCRVRWRQPGRAENPGPAAITKGNPDHI